jgi:hypothetical protein
MADEKGTGTTGTPEKKDGFYKGKYKTIEELEKAYENAEQKISAQADDVSELTGFVEKMAPYLTVDPDTGKVGFNEPVVKQAMGITEEGHSKAEKKDTPSKKSESSVGKQEDGSLEERISKILEEKLGSVLGENLKPLQDRLDKKDAETWVGSLKKKYSDFEEFNKPMLDYMNQNKFQPASEKQLEDVYLVTKGRAGGFVDKKEVEAERKNVTEMLAKSGTVFDPTGGFGGKEPAEVTGDDLLGLDENFDKGADDSKVAQALTGKRKEMLEPG